MLDDYGLPDNPTVKSASFFPVMSGLRKLGSLSMWAGVVGTAIFFLRSGRHPVPDEDEAVAAARARAGSEGAEAREQEK